MSDRESLIEADLVGERGRRQGDKTSGMRRSEARAAIPIAWKPPEEKPLEGVKPERETADRSAVEPGEVRMAPEFERILSKTYAIDAMKIADELEGKLAIPDADRVTYGYIAKRVGEASDNARKAHLLYVNAKAAQVEFEARVQTTMSALRSRAHASLAQLEVEGKLGKKKTITNDDVEAEMARIAPDEFERVRVKRARVALMVDQLQREAELHKHFPHTVEALLATSRSP